MIFRNAQQTALLLLSLSSALLPNTASAEPENSAEPLSFPEAPCSFGGEFTQEKFLTGLPESVSSSGHFFFHCEKGVIWSTDSPIQEALILRQDGKSLIRKDVQTKRLKGRQARFIGKLIRQLIAANTEAIHADFEVEHKDGGFLLKPKKKSLRRAIQHINLSWHEKNNDEQATVVISILDRNDQKTKISAAPSVQFNDMSTEAAIVNCQTIKTIEHDDCESLD